jgi:hypothetical protein
MTILAISTPFAFVFRQVLVVINAEAMAHAGLPLTDVNIAVAMQKSTSPFSSIILPLAFVSRTISPPHHSQAMTHVAFPLPIVDCAAPELVPRSTERAVGTCHRRLDCHELF